ncbi:hypothetical protein HETIRDRAFT_164226 [Heterobasidion irregulare TC 32-1]|uniref:Uncharacterized protein n=1 Tax=Heterobasidion irregulare (strain TC 32-1) TaxID=747525 RepID=W4JYS7_HETIT|nr:uncharacterized protein HETIRDRAFT_164226 [Heterobasidion irregulare TC 32-1]ETW78245.1 hypothetical protein HETIRDRAFT_164226 [Heterobasidion irregulare TC 32-1]
MHCEGANGTHQRVLVLEGRAPLRKFPRRVIASHGATRGSRNHGSKHSSGVGPEHRPELKPRESILSASQSRKHPSPGDPRGGNRRSRGPRPRATRRRRLPRAGSRRRSRSSRRTRLCDSAASAHPRKDRTGSPPSRRTARRWARRPARGGGRARGDRGLGGRWAGRLEEGVCGFGCGLAWPT